MALQNLTGSLPSPPFQVPDRSVPAPKGGQAARGERPAGLGEQELGDQSIVGIVFFGEVSD